jgi:hypothetical protein
MNNTTSFIPGILDLIRTSVPAKIILAIVLLLVALIVLLPLISKLKRKKIKEKETQDIVRDLMVWRHVARLAKGGEAHVKAKEELSDKLLKIDELLKQGFELAAAHGRGIYGVPWFMMLGEPLSGKSSLLQESELDIIPSAVEEPPVEGAEQKSLPLRIWLGGKAVICDVSGSVFFDRWLGGSSAEWSHIIKELCRRHSRMPLNGLILTIPADALLSDSGDLTRKKAVLMANELAHLLDASGMHLPCYLLVTKLDMVEGFREYVIGLSGELRHQILGFENDGDYYDPVKFKEFWNKLLEKLRSGYNKALLSRDVALHLYNTQNRMDLTGKMFLFAETFASMYENLNIYLETLFSEDNFHGTKETIFDGLFFTSALDTGISLSPAIAALAGKNTDDVPLAGKRPVVSKSYFVRNTLQNFIFNPSPYAGFVRKKALSRSIPAFVLCGIIVVTGIIFFTTAIFGHDNTKVSFSVVAGYYDSLTSVIKDGSAGKMPVIIKNSDGSHAINSTPDPSLNGISPMQFYTNAVSYRFTKLTPPFGFSLSGLLVFGGLDAGLRDRIFITNALYRPLIRIPMIKSVGDKLTEDALSPPVLDSKLRSLIQSFIILDDTQKTDMKRAIPSKLYSPEAMTDYILPDISRETRTLLSGDLRPSSGRRHSFAAEMAYINSDDFIKAKSAALQIMLSDWQNFSVYPDSLYGKLKRLVVISQNIVTNYSQIEFLLSTANSAGTLREIQNLVGAWKDLTQTQENLISEGTEIFNDITGEVKKLKIPFDISSAIGNSSAGTSAGTDDPFGNNLVNNYIFNDLLIRHATAEYTSLFQKDMDFIKDNSFGIVNTALDSISTLENVFSGNLNKEITGLRESAQDLKTNTLLSGKLTNDANAPSLFTTIEKIVNLAGAINIPDPQEIKKSGNINWMNGQYDIVSAFNNFESYVKPLEDNDKLANLIGNARIVLAAEAYLNRYTVLSAEYDFLSSSPEIITAMISSRAEDSMADLFSLSGRAIESALGRLPYNNGYDPNIVKNLIDGISAYSALFTQGINLKTMPRFLQNQDMSIYQTDAFSGYLDRYINYWGEYPDTAYLPVSGWHEYREKVNQNKPYQINSVLQTLYTECIGILNDVNDIVLTTALQQQKKNTISALNDKIKLLSAFLSADADRMLSAWSKLPADSEEAFRYLRSLSKDEIRNTYMTVYSDTRNISIGWWNNFIIDGINVLSKMFCRKRLDDFSSKLESFKLFPVLSDDSRNYAMTTAAVNDMAQLLEDMGAGALPLQHSDVRDFADELLHPVLFNGAVAQNWAETVYQFAAAVSNDVSPLSWSLKQPAIDVQGRLSMSGHLLAVNRFRYIEVSTTGKSPKSFNTYLNEETTLATGSSADRGINLKFYRSSADSIPSETVNIDDPWSIFSLYLNKDVIRAGAEHFFPVFMSDELGRYAYFMKIEFKPDIPVPEKWFSSSTWPRLVVSDGVVTASR